MNAIVPYKGTGKKILAADFAALAAEYGIEVPSLRAVMEVEARGSGFYKDGSVISLYEPHIAYKYAGKYRQALVSKGLAYESWKQDYPPTSLQRINDAAKYSTAEIAALSTSWGLGQIMGFNHEAAGFNSALDMVSSFAKGEVDQTRGMLNFIKSSPTMMKALKAKDWDTFARLYNGKQYKKNRYQIKLANAYAKWSAPGNKNKQTVIIDNLLDRGDKGENVYQLQIKLQALGYGPKNADKDFGKLTEDAVIKFQKDNKLKADGQAGTTTLSLLDKLYYAKTGKKPLVIAAPSLSPVAHKLIEETIETFHSSDKEIDKSALPVPSKDNMKLNDPIMEAAIDLVKPKKATITDILFKIGLKILGAFFPKPKE